MAANQVVFPLVLFLISFESTGAPVSLGTYNNYNYEHKNDGLQSLSDASKLCSKRLLWIADEAELNWLKTTGMPKTDYWTIAKDGEREWPNGQAFPPTIPITGISAIGNSLILKLNSSTLEWQPKTGRNEVICKTTRSTKFMNVKSATKLKMQLAPTPTCSRNDSCLKFHPHALNRYQSKIEALESIKSDHVSTCAARCIVNQACCAFEIRGEYCRLFSEIAQKLWKVELGAKIYGVGTLKS